MTRVLINEELRRMLPDLSQPLEFCDGAGRVLGQYVPRLDPALYEGLECPIGDEEIRRRLQYKGQTYTTAEVLKHLEQLP